METPIITISIIDEQSTRQDELRELYLKWISENEVRNKDRHCEILRPGPDKGNVNACFW